MRGWGFVAAHGKIIKAIPQRMLVELLRDEGDIWPGGHKTFVPKESDAGASTAQSENRILEPSKGESITWGWDFLQFDSFCL